MARIAGVDLPLNKRVEIGLTYIFGIGRSRSNDILDKAQVSRDTRVKDLTEDDVRKIRQVITDEGKVLKYLKEGDDWNLKTPSDNPFQLKQHGSEIHVGDVRNCAANCPRAFPR